MRILLLTDGTDEVLPALDLLPYEVRTASVDSPVDPANPAAAVVDLILVDAVRRLRDARATCRMLSATGSRTPLIAVVDEAGLAAVSHGWCVDDVVLATAGPAEVAARVRLAVDRGGDPSGAGGGNVIRAGDLSIDADTYTVKLRGAAMALTYKEFELLRYLAQHPGRVFSRDQLLREVWGYDYFGGTRTVDVHVRRLRAKLGPQHDAMIGTVRQVGYKFVVPAVGQPPQDREIVGADQPIRSLANAGS